jgi:membrane fusion protein, peptide pheromone/bacteriocin exporter
MSKSKIFPPEIVEFSVENYFSKQHSTSVIIYLITVLAILVFIACLPIIKVDISSQSRGILRSEQENNSLISAVYGEIEFSNLWENKTVKQGDTLIIIKTDKINEEISITKQKIDENEGYISDLKGLISNFRYKPKTNIYLSEYLAFMMEYQGKELEFNQMKKEFELDQKLYEKSAIASVECEKKKNEYEMSENRLKLLLDQKTNEWQSRLLSLTPKNPFSSESPWN